MSADLWSGTSTRTTNFIPVNSTQYLRVDLIESFDIGSGVVVIQSTGGRTYEFTGSRAAFLKAAGFEEASA